MQPDNASDLFFQSLVYIGPGLQIPHKAILDTLMVTAEEENSKFCIY